MSDEVKSKDIEILKKDKAQFEISLKNCKKDLDSTIEARNNALNNIDTLGNYFSDEHATLIETLNGLNAHINYLQDKVFNLEQEVDVYTKIISDIESGKLESPLQEGSDDLSTR